MNWGSTFVQNGLVSKEGFDTTSYDLYKEGDTNTPLTSHSVDLPINTTYQCENWCGPNAQCSITREQCTSDVDCQGCQPVFKNLEQPVTKDVRGQNDAGKLTTSLTPQYSTLTTDIGTQALLYNKKALVPKPYLGVDKWMKSSEVGAQLFHERMNYMYLQDPAKMKNELHYPTRETATGLYEDRGPLASNAYL
jgi:hypothetical protein